MPLFSIVIATYNRVQFISKAIQSVQNQTYADWELIIVDDGSKDNTKEVVELFLIDTRIKYVYQENQERSVARNNGIAQSQGEYICFLDSDDYYLPNHLETFSHHINSKEHTDKDILTVSRSYETNQQQEIVCFKDEKYKTKNEELLHRAIIDSPPIQCICIHYNFFKKVKFKNDWIPFECNQFSFDLLIAGFHYKLLPVHSVVMVNHESNSTVYNYPFIKKKHQFVVHHAKMINELKHPLVVKTKLNAFLGMADTSQSVKEASKLLMAALILNPSILFSRYYWGIIKNNIIKL